MAIFPTKLMALYRSHCFALWWLPLSFAFSLNTRRGIEISGVGQFIQGGVESEGASLWNICAGKLFMDIFSWSVQLSMFKTHEKFPLQTPLIHILQYTEIIPFPAIIIDWHIQAYFSVFVLGFHPSIWLRCDVYWLLNYQNCTANITRDKILQSHQSSSRGWVDLGAVHIVHNTG